MVLIYTYKISRRARLFTLLILQVLNYIKYISLHSTDSYVMIYVTHVFFHVIDVYTTTILLLC